MFRQMTEPANESEALVRCRASAREGTYVMTEVAESRLKADGHSPADVRHALENAVECKAAGTMGTKARWSVKGPSVDGAELLLTVAFDSDVALVL